MLGDIEQNWWGELLRGTPTGVAVIALGGWMRAEIKLWRGIASAFVKALKEVAEGLQLVAKSGKGGDSNGKSSS